MKTVKYGSTGIPVRVLQASLRHRGYTDNKGDEIIVDGKFGTKTKAALLKFQKDYELEEKAICGDATWSRLYFIPTKNPKIMVMKIPFNDIESANILLKDKQAYSVEKFSNDTGCEIVINGGFFSIKNNENVTDMVVNGVLINGGNYTNKGIAFGNDFRKYGAYASTTSNSKGKDVDFMGGCPILIQNGVKNVDMKGIPNSLYTQITRRNCDGIDNRNYFIFITMNNCTLEDMVQEGLYQKVKTMRNNDGGGSQSFCLYGKSIIHTTRGIPSAIGINLAHRAEIIKIHSSS